MAVMAQILCKSLVSSLKPPDLELFGLVGEALSQDRAEIHQVQPHALAARTGADEGDEPATFRAPTPML